MPPGLGPFDSAPALSLELFVRRNIVDHYKKATENDMLILSISHDGQSYGIASRDDPNPDLYTGSPDLRGYTEISREEAEKILGYDPEE